MTLRLPHAGSTLLVGLALMLTGCSASSFDGSEENAPPEAETVDNGSARYESQTPPTGSSHYLDPEEEEEVPADRPAVVAGAFLACVDLSESRDEVAFGCGVHRNGHRVSMDRLDASWWVERNGERLDVDMQYQTRAGYHVYVRMPSSAVAGASLYVLIRGGFEGNASDVLLSRRLDESLLGFALQSEERLGYHLGNGNFSGSSCQKALTGEPVHGTTVYFDFLLQEPTKIAVTLTDLCGVDIRGANIVELLDDRDIVYKRTLSPGATRFDGNVLKLPPGEYTLVIASEAYPFQGTVEYDDFLIGSIIIFSDRQIKSLGIEVENEAKTSGKATDPEPTEPISGPNLGAMRDPYGP